MHHRTIGPAARFFGVLFPDGLAAEYTTAPGARLDLPGLFTGNLLPGAPADLLYVTMPLREGVEMHYAPHQLGEPNHLASHLAAHHGYGPEPLFGPVYFTGDSAEADTAPGMDERARAALCGALRAVGDVLGLTPLPLHQAPTRARARAQDDELRDLLGLLAAARTFGGVRV